ncbi:hypothetical protein MBLNU230_g2583t1 [Neophaeotheca triangularis]
MSIPGAVSRLATYSAVAFGVYAIILGALLTPSLNRFALYAHKINTHFWDNVDQPETFGFGKGQVTPFNIQTPDGETLYAWHVLPLNVYAKNQEALQTFVQQNESFESYTASLPFRLLSQDPNARVVLSFHGNAGHVAQGWRTDTQRYLATQLNTHVLTIDYRGFGKSTGSPTEEGLITDGITLTNWAIRVAGISPERIVLLGQSLGTAVSSAIALSFADPKFEIREPKDTTAPLRGDIGVETPVLFAGIVLAAPFHNIPSLMLTYRLGGLVPLLLPLRPFPSLARMLTAQMTDKWFTAERLAAYYGARVHGAHGSKAGKELGGLQIVHAVDDMDISYHQSEMIAHRVLGQRARGIGAEDPVGVVDVKVEGRPRMRVEIVEYGGHNRLVTYTPVAVAVLRAFEGTIEL